MEALNTRATIRAVTGETVEIQDLWNGRRICLIFLRQLGCRWCRLQVAGMVESNLAARLKKHDVHLVCVSLGKVEQAKRWLEITQFDGELYVDENTYGDPSKGVELPQSVSYGIFSLKRSVSSLRLDDPEASKLAAEVALQYPDLEELAEKDGTMTIWPGDVFQTGGGERHRAGTKTAHVPQLLNSPNLLPTTPQHSFLGLEMFATMPTAQSMLVTTLRFQSSFGIPPVAKSPPARR